MSLSRHSKPRFEEQEMTPIEVNQKYTESEVKGAFVYAKIIHGGVSLPEHYFKINISIPTSCLVTVKSLNNNDEKIDYINEYKYQPYDIWYGDECKGCPLFCSNSIPSGLSECSDGMSDADWQNEIRDKLNTINTEANSFSKPFCDRVISQNSKCSKIQKFNYFCAKLYNCFPPIALLIHLYLVLTIFVVFFDMCYNNCEDNNNYLLTVLTDNPEWDSDNIARGILKGMVDVSKAVQRPNMNLYICSSTEDVLHTTEKSSFIIETTFYSVLFMTDFQYKKLRDNDNNDIEARLDTETR